MDYDVVIIGAGLSGLAAGIRLAQFDKKVLIVESHTVVGGLNSYYSRKNRTFDVGLHAMTNFSPKGDRSSPLGKLLKQLRFRHDDFQLCQQQVSEIRFPEKRLGFTNDFAFLEQEVADQFPDQIDGFLKLVKIVEEYDELNLNNGDWVSSRQILEGCISDPVLIDMLFCPLMYYGNAQERDMDFYQFVIMFKAIFFQGFAKPMGGMPHILGLLVEKYKNLGGELRMDAEVQRLETRQGKIHSVVLVSGEQISAAKVISSMGYVETLEKVEPSLSDPDAVEPGRLSFMESLFVLDQDAKELGYDKSITFFCTQPRFDYRVPGELIDVNSGVLCCPGNFDYPEKPTEGMIRLTNLANFKLWDGMTRKEYIAAKKQQRAQNHQEVHRPFEWRGLRVSSQN